MPTQKQEARAGAPLHIKANAAETYTALQTLTLVSQLIVLPGCKMENHGKLLVMLCELVEGFMVGDDAVPLADELLLRFEAYHKLRVQVYGIKVITPKQHYGYHCCLQLKKFKRLQNSFNPEAFHMLAKRGL